MAATFARADPERARAFFGASEPGVSELALASGLLQLDPHDASAQARARAALGRLRPDLAQERARGLSLLELIAGLGLREAFTDTFEKWKEAQDRRC